MTSEGLVEMFDGDSADTCVGKYLLLLLGGPSGGSSVRRPGSEDPNWRQRNIRFSKSCYHVTITFLSPCVIICSKVTNIGKLFRHYGTMK